MKTNTMKKVLGSIAIASAFVFIPSAFADTAATTSSSVRINNNGTVQVKNAEVTSVNGNVVSAVTHFANLITSWVFTTNASTTIVTNSQNATTSTSNIRVGDKLNVTGALTALGATLSVNATKIMDKTFMNLFHIRTGTVVSVNTNNGTFVLKTNDKLVTVQTNASTTFAVAAKGTPNVTTTTLAGILVGAKVSVNGTLNADKTVITATKVLVKPVVVKSDKREDKKENNGSDKGLKNGWKDKEDRTNDGEHRGFLNVGIDTNTHIGI